MFVLIRNTIFALILQFVYTQGDVTSHTHAIAILWV